MGTHASAEAFYGASWGAEEMPERWEDLGLYDHKDGGWEALEEILEGLGLSDLLEVTSHGNQAYDYTGYAVYVKGTDRRFYIGEPKAMPASPEVSPEAEAALARVLDHLGHEGATVGWQIAVSYG
jgi:hypothetical protein